MGKKLYVGNLNYNTTEEGLMDLFDECGEVVSSKLIVDPFTGKTKGFAFVEMSTDEEAQGAIEKLNGLEVEGRQIRVNEAFDKRNGGGRQGGGRNNNFRSGGGYNNNRY